jgi:hypothetical protein
MDLFSSGASHDSLARRGIETNHCPAFGTLALALDWLPWVRTKFADYDSENSGLKCIPEISNGYFRK